MIVAQVFHVCVILDKMHFSVEHCLLSIYVEHTSVSVSEVLCFPPKASRLE